LTLSFLLNLIDGIIEQPSRILIMTTNHPEQIDPALLRPGRVDIKHEFKRCTKPIIKEIIEFFFNQESQVDVSQLHDYAHSPADVIAACMSTSNGKSTVQLLTEQALPNVVMEAEKTLACNEQ
jgi:ATP-dependent 26S proteasome regulatory subunit